MADECEHENTYRGTHLHVGPGRRWIKRVRDRRLTCRDCGRKVSSKKKPLRKNFGGSDEDYENLWDNPHEVKGTFY